LSQSIFVPAQDAADWRRLLASPEKQWRTGYSARTLAYCWHAATGFPPEVAALFAHSGNGAFNPLELLLALPEHKVFLPPRSGHPSQNDLFALAKAQDGQLLAIMIEGKVAESFGETLGSWNAEASPGKNERLAFICAQLGLPSQLPPDIRYQLFHRTVSAVIEALRFNAAHAAMIVHSFSPSDYGFDEYQKFLNLFDAQASTPGQLSFLKEINGIKLWAGWARGDPEYLLK